MSDLSESELAEIEREHRETYLGIDGERCCLRCCGTAPCLYSRLAAALREARAENDMRWTDALNLTPMTPDEAAAFVRDNWLRPLTQISEVVGLSPLKYPNGRRLPDPELCQDAAFAAFVLGGLEAECARLRADLARAEGERERLREALEWLRAPLETAIRQARPSADVPSNVEVYWRTGADTVAELLAALTHPNPEKE